MYKPNLTLDPANPSLQAVFDFIVAHLRKQGPAFDPEFGCVYRTADEQSRMCAVGCLIADERYLTEFENCTITSHRGAKLRAAVCESLGLPATAFTDYDNPVLRLLSDLQAVHDSWAQGHCDLEHNLKELAKRHKLTLSPVAA